MKYFYQKPKDWVTAGTVYICEHPMFNHCTLFQDGERGLAVVQEKFNPIKKTRWWGTIEPWIAGDIFLNGHFQQYFNEHAGPADEHGIFPTVTLRKIMWALRMKPLKKEAWEEWG